MSTVLKSKEEKDEQIQTKPSCYYIFIEPVLLRSSTTMSQRSGFFGSQTGVFPDAK